ncbi:MAG: tetratricopeptide repeat protein [Ignavibacteriae bacterium]|nr:tetratricopeptide repeat protein [Ignavibacteriota bacterium]
MTFDQAEHQVEAAIELLNQAREVYNVYNYRDSELLANNALVILLPLEQLLDIGDEEDTDSLKYKVIFQIAHAYNRKMVIAIALTDFISAFDHGTLSITYAEKIHYYNRICQIYANYSAVYMGLDEDFRAIEYCYKALAIAGKYCEPSFSIGALSNLGEAYLRSGDHNKSLECSLKALALSEEVSSSEYIHILSGNIGVLYMDTCEYSKALEYLLKALNGSITQNDKHHHALWLGYLGHLYCKEDFEGHDSQIASEYLQLSFSIIQENNVSKYPHRKNYSLMAELYQMNGQHDRAYEYLKTFIQLDNEGKSADAKKEAIKFDFAYKTAERDKLLAVERAEADAIKHLLHKTLPKSIAERVIKGETQIADYFESASILFADVVGFTGISAKMPPEAVLRFMNFLFEHFDSIAEKHGCERIKTIGDGYMAVCGAPLKYENHTVRLAFMAMEMMDDLVLPYDILIHLPVGTVFELRIGIHCGEITAGLIGTGKLAYDIYGDAVNIAARMESHGEPGKIHVSEEFTRAVEVHSSLSNIHFTPRGEMDIKGKGMMKTYFLERAIQ